MAWLENGYHCPACDTDWCGEWSCACDDTCPNCGCADVSPYDSVDLSVFVRKRPDWFAVYYSSAYAESDPRYRLFAAVKSAAKLNALVSQARLASLGVVH
jgi:hypothetical protein